MIVNGDEGHEEVTGLNPTDLPLATSVGLTLEKQLRDPIGQLRHGHPSLR
jgi:hypothetical protein